MDNYVGPYRILRLINRGGQGSVYLGYDKRLHRRVAIKIYPLPSTRAARKQLLVEAQLVAKIQSPKVVQIHDVIESGTHLALIMEYVPGCSLEEFLAAERPSISSVLTVGADVAGALALARQEHIVHGDVKAANVLITTTGRAKLTDFGISRTTGEEAFPRRRGGSLAALSPEQYRGETLDEQVDLFALGALLYRMLSGEQPFFRGGQLDPDLLLNRNPRPLLEVVGAEVELPDELVATIAHLLQKNPQDRPAHTRGVRQVFRAVARSLPVSASTSLLREAQPLFRPESPEDIPPLVPESLGQRARSALSQPTEGLAVYWHWFTRLALPVRASLSLLLATALGWPLLVALRGTEVPVRFTEPETIVTTTHTLPPEISQVWLVEEMKSALTEELGVLHVLGSVGAPPKTVLYTQGEPERLLPQAEQLFKLALRCDDDTCVLAITREQAGKRYHQQSILFPDMPLQQWQDIVHSTTLALYP